MKTTTYEIRNNLMAGLTLRAIEEKFPCFTNLSCAYFENMSSRIEVTISCRLEDVKAIEEYLEPFFLGEDE